MIITFSPSFLPPLFLFLSTRDGFTQSQEVPALASSDSADLGCETWGVGGTLAPDSWNLSGAHGLDPHCQVLQDSSQTQVAGSRVEATLHFSKHAQECNDYSSSCYSFSLLFVVLIFSLILHFSLNWCIQSARLYEAEDLEEWEVIYKTVLPEINTICKTQEEIIIPHGWKERHSVHSTKLHMFIGRALSLFL